MSSSLIAQFDYDVAWHEHEMVDYIEVYEETGNESYAEYAMFHHFCMLETLDERSAFLKEMAEDDLAIYYLVIQTKFYAMMEAQ
jgi:hypothetical protein